MICEILSVNSCLNEQGKSTTWVPAHTRINSNKKEDKQGRYSNQTIQVREKQSGEINWQKNWDGGSKGSQSYMIQRKVG